MTDDKAVELAAAARPPRAGLLQCDGVVAPGPGQDVTIYASPSHAWMTINGRRYDTVALEQTGTRWAGGGGEYDGFVVRHPVGF